MKNKLERIFLHFGLKKQLLKLGEECLELIEAMLENDREHIKEEIADVMVIASEFKEFYEITDTELIEMIEYKIDRTIDRIDEGYYEK